MYQQIQQEIEERAVIVPHGLASLVLQRNSEAGEFANHVNAQYFVVTTYCPENFAAPCEEGPEGVTETA